MSTELKTVAWADLRTGRVWKRQERPEHVALVFREEAEAEIARLRLAAERYRKIRSGTAYTVKMKQATVIVGPSREKDYGEALDAALDALNPGEQDGR